MKSMKVRDLMTAKVTTLGREDRLDVADEILAMGPFRHLPVVEEGMVVGILSQRDVFRSSWTSALGIGTNTRRKLLQAVRVKEVMSEPVITIDPDATVRRAAVLMLDNGIGCLPVVTEGRLQGVLTETDLLRCLAEDEAPSRTTVAELPAVAQSRR